MDTKEKSKWKLFKEGTTSPRTLSEATIVFLIGIILGAFVAAYKFIETNIGLTIMFTSLGLLQGVSLIREVKQLKGLKAIEKEIKEEEIKQTRLE